MKSKLTNVSLSFTLSHPFLYEKTENSIPQDEGHDGKHRPKQTVLRQRKHVADIVIASPSVRSCHDPVLHNDFLIAPQGF
jgi:hypothetical protein